MNKKILWASSIALTLGLAACGTTDTEETTSTNDMNETSEVAETTDGEKVT